MKLILIDPYAINNIKSLKVQDIRQLVLDITEIIKCMPIIIFILYKDIKNQ